MSLINRIKTGRSVLPHRKKSTAAHVTLILLLWAVYLISLCLLTSTLKQGALFLSGLPLLAAAWFYGLPGGLLSATVLVAVNLLFQHILRIDPALALDRGTTIVGIGVFYITGGLVGYISDLYRELKRETTTRIQTQEMLGETVEQYQLVSELSPFPISIIDPDGRYLYINSRFTEDFGYTLEDIPSGKDWFNKAYPDTEYRERVKSIWISDLESSGKHKVRPREFKVRCKDGATRDIIFRPVAMSDGRQLIIYEDFTQQNKLENELRQAQKMEAVGKLAGGIAHDFNNILTVIMGVSDLSLSSLEQTNPLHSKLQEIMNAAERAASLTKQLLAFSRKQMLLPIVLDPNELIRNIRKMLRRLIGEDIELVTVPADALWYIKADPSQIEQVILNLAVNARDAMPYGGRLRIETENAAIDGEQVEAHVGLKPGSYVLIRASDTGVGIDQEHLTHIFEPFYTTKKKGEGTGLGLSTVYGIVKQSQGYIYVMSEPGEGTTVEIYLPRALEEQKQEKKLPAKPLRGTESILLVEDEASVRSFIKAVLDRNGYSILEAENGKEALEICKEHDKKIQLIITDVVMPKMSGRELMEKVSSFNPHIKVLFISGYTGDTILHHGVLYQGLNYLQKPFKAESLLEKIRLIVDGE